MDISRANNRELPADLANKQSSPRLDEIRRRSDKLKELLPEKISQHGGRTGFLFDYDGTMSHPEKRRALVDDFEKIAMEVRKKGHEQSFNTGRPYKVSCKTMGLTIHCYKFAVNPDINKEEKERTIKELIYKPLTLIASNCLAKKPEYKAFKLADPKYTGIDIGLKEDINIKGDPLPK